MCAWTVSDGSEPPSLATIVVAMAVVALVVAAAVAAVVALVVTGTP